MLELIAHAGEVHETSSDSFLHYLGVWYIALIVFVVGTYLIGSIVYLLTKKSVSKALGVLLFSYLIVGLGMYEKSPVLSVLSICAGFLIASAVAFSSLAGPKK